MQACVHICAHPGAVNPGLNDSRGRQAFSAGAGGISFCGPPSGAQARPAQNCSFHRHIHRRRGFLLVGDECQLLATLPPGPGFHGCLHPPLPLHPRLGQASKVPTKPLPPTPNRAAAGDQLGSFPDGLPHPRRGKRAPTCS